MLSVLVEVRTNPGRGTQTRYGDLLSSKTYRVPREVSFNQWDEVSNLQLCRRFEKFLPVLPTGQAYWIRAKGE